MATKKGNKFRRRPCAFWRFRSNTFVQCHISDFVSHFYSPFFGRNSACSLNVYYNSFLYKLPNLKSKSTIVITRNKKLNRISDDVDVQRIFEAVSRKVNKINMSNIKHWFFQTCYVFSNLLMKFKK